MKRMADATCILKRASSTFIKNPKKNTKLKTLLKKVKKLIKNEEDGRRNLHTKACIFYFYKKPKKNKKLKNPS
jgi:hypothetical protein